MNWRSTHEGGLRWPRRIVTPAEAVKFINAAGFCMLFPVASVPLPSLYCAVTLRRPRDGVIFDKYFEMVWDWKDQLPQRRRAFYAKVFRGRGTLISRRQLPNFLAMRNAAVEAGDHERFYRAGRIGEDARVIWKTLDELGPLATLELRHASKMETMAGNIRYKRAMLELQCMLIVSHFGAEQETGAWASNRFELTCRAFPEETAEAASMAPEAARAKVAAKHREHYPSAKASQWARMFGWTKDEALAAYALVGVETRHTKSGRRR
jgi:hypothetical protein